MMNPAPKITMPTLTITLGPNLSMSQPWIGPRMPLSARDRANAPDNMARLQPNWYCSSGKYAVKLWIINDPTTICIMKPPETIHHP